MERGGRIAVGVGEMPLEAQALTAAGQERALVESCRSGDPVAFARLVRLHEGMVFGLSARLLGNAEEARDVAQEVFLQVYRQLGRFEGRSSLKTWIYRIAVNHALNYLKRERRNVWLDLMDETVGDLLARERVDSVSFPVRTLPPDLLVENKEREELAQAAIDALSPKYRIPFVLFKEEHRSYDEIAGILGISHSAVETRIHRARKTLIRKLGPLFK